MAKYYDWVGTTELAVKSEGKYGVFISNNLNYDKKDMIVWEFITNKLKKKLDNDFSNIIHGGLFLFDTKQEATDFFTVFNHNKVYASPVYAALVSPTEGLIIENT